MAAQIAGETTHHWSGIPVVEADGGAAARDRTQTLHQSRSRVENLLAITTNFTFSILTNFTSYKKVDHFPIITIDKTFGPFIEEMWLCTFCVVLRISNFSLSIYCCCTIIVYFRPAFV